MLRKIMNGEGSGFVNAMLDAGEGLSKAYQRADTKNMRRLFDDSPAWRGLLDRIYNHAPEKFLGRACAAYLLGYGAQEVAALIPWND